MDAVDGHSEQHRPLGGYAALIALFNAPAVAGLVAAERAGRLPDRWRAGDLALYAVGSFRLARLLSRDRVTSVLRAPFTRFQGDAGMGEVDEAARGRGVRRAVGELLVCPVCVGQWVAAGFVAGHVANPRIARTVAAVFTVYAAADAMHFAQARARGMDP